MRALMLPFALALVLPSACSDEAASPDGGPGADASTDSETVTDASTDSETVTDSETAEDSATAPDSGTDSAIAAPCTLTPAPGLSEHTLEFGGDTRTYQLMIPTAHDGTGHLPLVFDIHGFTESADRQERRSGMRVAGEAEGFIVVQPEGAARSWNGGGLCCGEAVRRDLDDVGLMVAILEDVAGRACVDRARVYATGMSNGGFLSHRIACEASDTFAAIAPVAGVIGVDPDACRPARAVPVMHVHGTGDAVVPYGGNLLLGYPSVEATIAHWIDRHGCDETPRDTTTSGATTCETWGGCADGAEVVLCTVAGGAHVWPVASSGLPATDAIWDFLSRHRL